MDTAQAVTQPDFLKEHADNIWFVLVAYCCAFFPWTVLNNIDFISEKWRPCRRTRELAYVHLALTIFPFMFVVVYAVAQRRVEDNKEFGAALAALLFNSFQLMRTLMGLVQLNAFLAWSKHAALCIRVLNGLDDHGLQRTDGRSRDVTRTQMGWRNVFVLWFKRCKQCLCTLLGRGRSNVEHDNNGDAENSEPTVNGHENDVRSAKPYTRALSGVNLENRFPDGNSNAEVSEETEKYVDQSNLCSSEQTSKQESARIPEVEQRNAIASWSNCLSMSAGHRKVDVGSEIEKELIVNNMIIDNELGGREVTVKPSWKKIWGGVKKGKLTPWKWLWTDRAILSTLRWSGAYLCGMGEDWSVLKCNSDGECHEILETFFSRKMEKARFALQQVQWDMNLQSPGSQFLQICPSLDDQRVPLTGEMTAAYGKCDAKYNEGNTSSVDTYAFEFENLVSSYPAADNEQGEYGYREKVVVGLVHSVLLAKNMGLEKLKAIRRYYDRHHLANDSIHHNALNLLLRQTKACTADDAYICTMFKSISNIPMFPYRMQMVSLWDEATNYRVLQASAHQDIENSRCCVDAMKLDGKRWIHHNSGRRLNIFEYCANCTIQELDRKTVLPQGSLGVVMESVRTFLAEWISTNPQEPEWEPKVSTAFVEFDRRGIPQDSGDWNLIWICQRELQKKVAQMSRENGSLTGNGALIMLFILGFPLLCVEYEHDFDCGERSIQDNVCEGSASVSASKDTKVDVNAQVWRASTPLAPQHISIIIRFDPDRGKVALQLENNGSDLRFLWQDWVDAAMGCLKGFEEGRDGKWGYGRKIVKAELRKPIVELCPPRANENGIEAVVQSGCKVRVWTGWPAFDMRICKFEVDQLLNAWNVDWRNAKAYELIQSVEELLEGIVSAESE